jgi:hypothetical protein
MKKGLRPRRGLWFVLTAVVAMTMAYAVTKVFIRGSKPHVLAFGAKDHLNKNFNSFPIEIPEREFDDWLS